MSSPNHTPEPDAKTTTDVPAAASTGLSSTSVRREEAPDGIAQPDVLSTLQDMTTPTPPEETVLAKRKSLTLTPALAAINTFIIGSAIALFGAILFLDPHITPQIGLAVGSPLMGIIVGVGFWTLLTYGAAVSQVEMPRGIKIAPTLIPCLAAAFLGGPLAGAFVAFVGSTEKRELSAKIPRVFYAILDRARRRPAREAGKGWGDVPWYGVLSNHSSIASSAMIAGVIYSYFLHPSTSNFLPLDFGAAFVAGFIAVSANAATAALVVSHRLGRSYWGVIKVDLKDTYIAFCALVPFAWLFMFLYSAAGFWAALLAAAPLYTVRTANQRFVEMRETFVQAIRALAHALDARDIYTAGHSHRMSEVAVDIGVVMGLSDDDSEHLEWAGILHDVGKIGVPDSVLLKQGRLDDTERDLIEAHPVIGALIVAPVTRLSPEVPLIRHHHERWDGKGYPDGLAGEDIPKLARILAVADSFEAMTAQRPYRMNPLSPQEAYAEIVKCSGAQFDPAVVEAFGHTKWARGEYDTTRGNMDPRFADVKMVSGSARHVNEVKASRRIRQVEFVDPHGDEARAKEAAAAAALSAQALAAAEMAVRRGHGHDEHTHEEKPKAAQA